MRDKVVSHNTAKLPLTDLQSACFQRMVLRSVRKNAKDKEGSFKITKSSASESSPLFLYCSKRYYKLTLLTISILCSHYHHLSLSTDAPYPQTTTAWDWRED